MEDNRNLSSFLLGLGIGVAVGLLFAPTSGSEARQLIRSKAAEGGDYLRRRGEELKETAAELVDRSKSAVQRQREQLSAAIEAGKQAYREAVSGAREASPGAQG
jgi:gas vesicle protein